MSIDINKKMEGKHYLIFYGVFLALAGIWLALIPATVMELVPTTVPTSVSGYFAGIGCLFCLFCARFHYKKLMETLMESNKDLIYFGIFSGLIGAWLILVPISWYLLIPLVLCTFISKYHYKKLDKLVSEKKK